MEVYADVTLCPRRPAEPVRPLLALLGLLTWLWQALPAQAQGPDPGHRWNVTYASSGACNMHYVYGGPYSVFADSRNWTVTAGATSAPTNGGVDGQYYVDASSAGTVTATLTWVPATGQTDPPPHTVIVAQTASATAMNGCNAGGAYQADDGLGDTP